MWISVCTCPPGHANPGAPACLESLERPRLRLDGLGRAGSAPRDERRHLAGVAVQTPVAERVLAGALEAGADHAACAGGDGEAALVEPVHRDLEALSLLADQVLGRHLDVLEEELARGAGPDAELVLGVRGREAGGALLDDE